MNVIVSVIVPVYNVEKYLNRCIDSILDQTYTNFELILVDDGSTDNSGLICDEYSKKYNQIKVIHKKNGGLSSARNAALEVIQGELFTYIDSDDWIESQYLEKMVGEITEGNYDIVQCGYCIKDSTNSISYTFSPHDELLDSKKKILDSFFIDKHFVTMACMKIYKTSKFVNIRFMEGRNNEDTIYFADYIDYIENAKIIEDVMYNYYVNENSIMHMKIDRKKIDDAYYSAKYMLNKCKESFKEYSIYMCYNICRISMNLYMQAFDENLTIKRIISDEFDTYFHLIKKCYKKEERLLFIKCLLFKFSKRLYRLVWRIYERKK